MDLKAFKLFGHGDRVDNMIRSQSKSDLTSNLSQQMLFSLKELMARETSFLADKVFSLTLASDN
jgi:hypothetical protein